jgi:thiamine transport system permease protein
LVPLVFLAAFYVWPLGRMLGSTLESDAAGRILSDQRTWSTIWFTTWQAAVSTVLTVLAALPLTYVIARYRFKGRRLVQALTTVPFVLPSMVVATAFVAIGLDSGLAAILMAHVFYNVAVIVRTVGGLWSRLDPSLSEAARTLGASPARAFRQVTLPLLRPALTAATAIVFVFTFTSFGVVLVLGGLRWRTLEVEIYQRATTFLDFPAASALAVLQLVVVSLIVWWYSRRQALMTASGLVAESENLMGVTSSRQRWLVGSALTISIGLLSAPLMVLVAKSFAGGGAGWALLFSPGPSALRPIPAIGNTVVYAVMSTLVAVAIGLPAAVIIARRRRLGSLLDLGLLLPLGTSAVTIGLGLLMTWSGTLTVWLIPIAHALVALPFVTRSAVPVLGSIRSELREAAAVLGASPGRTWREVDLPIAARAFAVGAGFAAAISIGEFGATAFLARPATATVPYLIFRYLGRPGSASFTAAMAMAVLLMLLTAGLILAVDRLRTEQVGSF